MSDSKEKLASWMNEVMSSNNWTTEEWARKAETSATNITRFLKELKYYPSGRTIDALAGCTNIPVPIGGKSFHISGRSLRVIEPALGKVEALWEQSDEHVITLEPVSDGSFAVKLCSDRMSMAGMLPGDVIIVEPVKVVKPLPNDVVVYFTEDGVEAGRWHPPFLMPQSSAEDHLPVKLQSVHVLGVARQSIRRF